MKKIDYHNMPNGVNKLNFTLRYIFNMLRTWYTFHVRYPWVKYNGFVRVLAKTTFARKEIELGNNVQIGQFCHLDCNLKIGDNVLIAGRVCFIEKYGHQFNVPGKTIWDSQHGKEEKTIVGNDVWICDGALILSGCKIKDGSVILARSVVTHDVPECEVWGGIPARKIKDRFSSEKEKREHLRYLSTL